MKKHRICTTISIKHWEMLEKYRQNYQTQQKVLETALENMEKAQSTALSPEMHLWMRIGSELKVICHLHRDIFFELLRTADFGRIEEIITRLKITEYQIIFYYQKPLKECSLKEVMDGIVITTKIGNWLDTINYTDEGSFYTLKATHSAGSINFSKLLKKYFEILFDSYGAKTHCDMSENSLFIKVFKEL